MQIKVRDVIEMLAIPLLSAAVWILWQMNDNINKLNIQVGVIISERSNDKETLKDLSFRVHELELLTAKFKR